MRNKELYVALFFLFLAGAIIIGWAAISLEWKLPKRKYTPIIKQIEQNLKYMNADRQTEFKEEILELF